MTPEAVLYWLPHFFNFIENKAKPDSLHFELIRQHFVDESWVRDIKEYATPQELKTIQTFIQWFGQQPLIIWLPFGIIINFIIPISNTAQ